MNEASPDVASLEAAATARRQSAARFRALTEHLVDCITVVDAAGVIRDQSPNSHRVVGYPAADLLGRNVRELVHPDDLAAAAAAAGALGAPQASATIELRARHQDGSWRWLHVTGQNLLNDPAVAGLLLTWRDVTERRQAYERVVAAQQAALRAMEDALASRQEAERASHELRRLNRTFKALSENSQAMMRATDEAGYLREVCRILQRDCGYAMIWIGYAQHDERKTIRPAAQAGFDEGYVERLDLTWADSARGRGPTGTAIRTGRPAGCGNMLTDPNFAPWREEALKRGYGSSLAVPLLSGGGPLGSVTIYAREPGAFAADEVRLLTELADDVAHGIVSLRLRAAHAEAAEALRAERDAVKDREEELAAIYEHAPLIMLLLDGERRVRKANRQAELFAGSSLTDLLGRRGGEALRCLHRADHLQGCGFGPRCDHCNLRRTILDTIESGRGHHQVEVTLATGNDVAPQHHTFLLSATRLNLRGQPMALATMQDITSRKQAEEALQRARAELELRVADRTARLRALAAELTQSEERERRRIAQILHDDLQQLLVGARLRLEAVRGRVTPKALVNELQRIERLITESGEVARNLSHELSPTVLHEHGFGPGLQWLGRWMREKHGLLTRIAADPAAEGLEADVKVLLYQAVRELLFNVVKHSGVKRARVCAKPAAAGWIEILVSDQGRGFDPAQFRAGRSADAGFGLFGIRERLASVGGRLEIESKPGRGCRFRLVAPLQNSPGAAFSPGDPKQPDRSRRAKQKHRGTVRGRSHAAARPQRATIRVLLADDHKIVRDGLAGILNAQDGIEVAGLAADGREAVALTAKLQPHVVVMDVSMPRLDGIAATRRIAAAWPHIKVVGLTMHADETSHNAMRAAGAIDCLVKTGPTDDLVAAIRTVTGSAIL
jgi:PAS domain S-box-containing protein